MNPIVKRLYWQLTVLLLAAHAFGVHAAMPAAIGLTAWQAAHALAARRSAMHLEVQVRVGFLLLLLIGLLPGGWVLHAAVFAGVNALLIAGYCPMARMLVLMPWNRSVPLSLGLVRWVLLAPPSDGPILARLAQWERVQASAAGQHP